MENFSPINHFLDCVRTEKIVIDQIKKIFFCSFALLAISGHSYSTYVLKLTPGTRNVSSAIFYKKGKGRSVVSEVCNALPIQEKAPILAGQGYIVTVVFVPLST